MSLRNHTFCFIKIIIIKTFFKKIITKEKGRGKKETRAGFRSGLVSISDWSRSNSKAV